MAQFDQHGGHPGLAQERDRHALDPFVDDPERRGHGGLDDLGESPATLRFGAVARVVGGRAASEVGVEAEAHQEVGFTGVRLAGLDRIVRMVHCGDTGATRGEATSERRKGRGQPAGLADGDVSADQGRRRVSERLPGPNRRDQLGASVPGLHAQQVAHGDRPDDAIGDQADVVLEIEDAGLGLLTEDSVHPPTVEAQRSEALLQFRHVVAPEHGGAAEQRPVTEPETRFDQGRPGLRSALAVNAQTSPVLEGLDRRPRRRAELPGRVLGRDEPQLAQADPEVGDEDTGRALRDGQSALDVYR
jgi:hypothetical protein